MDTSINHPGVLGTQGCLRLRKKRAEPYHGPIMPKPVSPAEGEQVFRPAHYARHKVEPVYFIGENRLDFLVGNVVKYVLRFDAKNGIEDLQKARRYLDMLIKREQGETGWSS